MGGRWAAAALVVLGIISSLNLQVEGQGLEAKDEDVETIVNGYGPLVNMGKNAGDKPCGMYDDEVVETIMKLSDKKDAAEVKSHYMFTGDPETQARNAADLIATHYPKMSKDGNWCKMKEALKCVEEVCTACATDASVGVCKDLIKIKERTGPVPSKKSGGGGGGSGGWLVRPVDGALVAALLAVFSLSV